MKRLELSGHWKAAGKATLSLRLSFFVTGDHREHSRNHKTLNSTALTCVTAVVVGALGLVGHQRYEFYKGPQLALEKTQTALKQARHDLEQSQQKVGDLKIDNTSKAERIDRLETSIPLLQVNHRLAELQVVEQRGRDEDSNLVSRISFVETNEQGHPSVFDIDGDMVYVD